MGMRIINLLMVMFLSCVLTGAFADEPNLPWYKKTDQGTTLRVDLFLSTTCPHCKKADAFFKKIQREKPWLKVNRYFINTDKEALETYSEYLNQQPKAIDAYGVPAIFFCKSQWVGFAEEATTGQKLLQALEYCHDQIEKSGTLNADTVKTIQQWSSASWYEGTITSEPAAWYFIPGMSLMDMLNPCAVFCLLTLLSLLLLQNTNREKIALACVFIAGVLAVHYFQQTHTARYYQWLEHLRIPAIALGAIMVIYAVMRWLHNQISIIIVLLASVAIAAVLQAYQQNCVPNFALIFQQWLTSQTLTPAWRMAYQLLYQVCYLLAWALVSFLLFRAITHKKSSAYQQFIINTALSALFLTGGVLLAYPQLLANLSFSFAILFLSVVAGWFISRIKSHKE